MNYKTNTVQAGALLETIQYRQFQRQQIKNETDETVKTIYINSTEKESVRIVLDYFYLFNKGN